MQSSFVPWKIRLRSIIGNRIPSDLWSVLDEGSKQLTKETRLPLPPRPGAVAKYDYEYERNGTSNLFLLFAPLQAWRHVKVTARRTMVDFAHCLRDLVDIHFRRLTRSSW